MTARVLVVDDHILNVKLLEAKLQVVGFTVDTAMNGEEALAKVAAERPNLVLLDVMMPGMDGYEVCRRLRANPATAGLPVIMVTALDKESDREAGMAAGAEEYLLKPFAPDQLTERVRAILSKFGK